MTDYPPPPRPQPHPAWQPQPEPAPRGGLPISLGERLTRRPEPRSAVALAGAGAAMILIGIVIWGGTYFGQGISGESFGGSSDRKLLGAGLGALVTVLGYAAVILRRRGPLATAGIVAAGLGLPVTLAFLTLDFGQFSGGLPINFDAVFWISAIVWIATYLLVPGAQGHTFFVFLFADGFYTYVLSKNTSSVSVQIFTRNGPHLGGFGTIAAISLIFGLGYYLVAFLLDRTGRYGPATGLLYPAFSATALGIIAWSPDLHLLGSGIVTILVGLVVCAYGGSFGRRLTCFIGAAAVALGVSLLIEKATDDGDVAGISFILVGCAVVAAAVLVAALFAERDDMDPDALVRSR